MSRAKVAVTDLAERIVTVQVVPATVSQPLQSVKRLAGLAVSVTTVSAVKSAAQVVPHEMPAGLELTSPTSRPRPALVTLSVKRGWSWTTVSVVVAVAPEASVAVIVVTPAPTPLARPAPSIVATAVLLLVHVMPGPLMATGTEEPVVVPFPNCPQSFTPQQRTVESLRRAQL
jgi:hypothetical protein